MLKALAQRLFGRTIIDALGLRKNAWYIDEEQVTASAADLNVPFVVPATSVTAAQLGPGIALGGLTGGNGQAVAYNPAHMHFELLPGVGPYGSVSVPGMQPGDKIISVASYVWTVAWLNSTAAFVAGNNVMTNTTVGDLTGYTMWVMWADVT